MSQELVDLLQGRTSQTIFMKFYCRPPTRRYKNKDTQKTRLGQLVLKTTADHQENIIEKRSSPLIIILITDRIFSLALFPCRFALL